MECVTWRDPLRRVHDRRNAMDSRRNGMRPSMDESISAFAEIVHSCKVRIILKYMEVVTRKELS